MIAQYTPGKEELRNYLFYSFTFIPLLPPPLEEALLE